MLVRSQVAEILWSHPSVVQVEAICAVALKPSSHLTLHNCPTAPPSAQKLGTSELCAGLGSAEQDVEIELESTIEFKA